MHKKPLGVLTGIYGEDEYLDDLLKVTKGKTDETLARLTICHSQDSYAWKHDHGGCFQEARAKGRVEYRTGAPGP